MLGAFKRFGQASITLSIDFLAANIARDTLMGGVMSRTGFKPFIDSVRGLKSRLVSDENYRAFVANGGGFSSYFVDEAAFRKHLERFYTKKGIDYGRMRSRTSSSSQVGASTTLPSDTFAIMERSKVMRIAGPILQSRAFAAKVRSADCSRETVLTVAAVLHCGDCQHLRPLLTNLP